MGTVVTERSGRRFGFEGGGGWKKEDCSGASRPIRWWLTWPADVGTLRVRVGTSIVSRESREVYPRYYFYPFVLFFMAHLSPDMPLCF